MITYQKRLIRLVNIVFDALSIALSLWIAYSIRMLLAEIFHFDYNIPFVFFLKALMFLIPVWLMLLYALGVYPINRLRSFRSVSIVLLKASFNLLLICIVLSYLLNLYKLGRVIIVVFAAMNFVFVCLKELIIRNSVKMAREKGFGLNNVLIIAERDNISDIKEHISKNHYLGVKIVLVHLIDGIEGEDDFEGIKVLGTKKDLKLALLKNNIDIAIFAVNKTTLQNIENMVLMCEEFGAEIWLNVDLFELIFARKELALLDNKPFLVFKTTPYTSSSIIVKRLLDIIGSLVLFILSSPFFLLAIIGIKLRSPGPVFFAQKRVGLHGRKFHFYKFRTMDTNAEQRRSEVEKLNMLKGPVFKAKNDPRIYPFGKILRKTSIDELPQLWNVLKGDMSLIGPRPPLPSEVSSYKGWQRRRLSMRPGISGLWQVTGRNKIKNFDELTKLDLKYIDTWSLYLDFVILFKTVFVVIFQIGAE